MTAPVEQKNPADLVVEMANKVDAQATTLDQNDAYYDAKSRPQAIGVSVPPEMRQLLAQVGWARVYLDSLEERLDLTGFRMPGSDKADERLQQWWQANNLGEQASLGHLEAMIHGRAFITVAAPDTKANPTLDPKVPVYRVESPRYFWADFDPITRVVRKAIRVYNDDQGQRIGATLFLPDSTIFMRNNHGRWETENAVNHGKGRVLVAPLVNREMLSTPNGASEITPEIRSVTDAACRIMMNAQAAAELMAVPQRILFGVTREELGGDKDDPTGKRAAFEAYHARILAFEEPGGTATQFHAAELRNYTEVMTELAKLAASYMGLPPQYLSFASDNPASAEAIRSSESRLVKKCERKSRMFGSAWEEAMRLGMLVIDGDIPPESHRIESIWNDPATPTYAAKADGVTKLYSAGIVPLERARVDMGYSPAEREQMREWDRDNPMKQLNSVLGGIPRMRTPSPLTTESADDGSSRVSS